MKAFIFIISIFSVVAVSCAHNKITVTGVAENRKDAAYVVVENDRSYGLAGVGHWPEEVLGKRVKVSGKLKAFDNDPIGPDEPQRQQITGKHYAILLPKWKVAEPEQKSN